MKKSDRLLKLMMPSFRTKFPFTYSNNKFKKVGETSNSSLRQPRKLFTYSLAQTSHTFIIHINHGDKLR